METELQFIHHREHRVAVLSGNPDASGMPLIFLHGIAGSVHFWPALLPPGVRQQRRWYSIGLPGHWPGGILPADRSNDYLSAALFAEILTAVIRKLSPTQPVALIGYSTGGFAALNLAAHEPELVAAVFSVSGFAVGKWHGVLGRLQSLASCGRAGRRACTILWSLSAFNPSVFQRLLLLNSNRKCPSSSQAESLLECMAHDAKQQRAAVLAELFANIRRFDIRPLLSRIRAPVLVAGGNCDPIIRCEHTCELAAAIPGAELVMFRDVGHLSFVECPIEFQDVLEAWVEQHCRIQEFQQTA